MNKSKIAGIGFYVPEKVVKNTDLEKLMDTSNEWIIERTGIHERRWVDEGVGTSTLSVEASKKAMNMAGITAEDIDLIICASVTSDYYFPGISAQVQDLLGTRRVGLLMLRLPARDSSMPFPSAISSLRPGRQKPFW